MKFRKAIITAQLLIFITGVFTASAWADSSSKKRVKIEFSNIDESDFNEYMLKEMPLSLYNIDRLYGQGIYSTVPSADTLKISYKNRDDKDNDWAVLESNSTDILNKQYFLNFRISKGNYFDNRYDESLKFTSELFFKSREKDIKSVFTDQLYNDGHIENLSPLYKKNEKDEIEEIQGYEFDYRIKRSPTYRAVRTTTEILLACGLGVANYYATKHENMVDWQYKYSWHDAKQKVKDGWYWDPNNFNTNTLYHLYAGNTYYQVARSNDYTVLESLAWTIGGSFFWEFVGEWREQVSLNDMIFTPMLGALVGETLIQTTNYIERNMRPSVFRDLIVIVLNPAGWINKRLDNSNSGSIRVQLMFKNPVQTAIEERIVESAK